MQFSIFVPYSEIFVSFYKIKQTFPSHFCCNLIIHAWIKYFFLS